MPRGKKKELDSKWRYMRTTLKLSSFLSYPSTVNKVRDSPSLLKFFGCLYNVKKLIEEVSAKRVILSVISPQTPSKFLIQVKF